VRVHAQAQALERRRGQRRALGEQPLALALAPGFELLGIHAGLTAQC
jgi:hypothetical protein